MDYNKLYLTAWSSLKTNGFNSRITQSHITDLINLLTPYFIKCAKSVSHRDCDMQDLCAEYGRRITAYMHKYKKSRGSPMGYMRTIIHSTNTRHINNKQKDKNKDKMELDDNIVHQDDISENAYVFNDLNYIFSYKKVENIIIGKRIVNDIDRELLKKYMRGEI